MRTRSAAAFALVTVLAVGCGGDDTDDSSAGGSVATTAGQTETTKGGSGTGTTGGVEDSTGEVPDYSHAADDLIAVLDTAGGFVPPGFIQSDYAEVSVYGDGTVIARDPASGLPVTATLAREEMDALIADLAAAGFFEPITGSCDNEQVADAGTTTITVHVAGGDAVVTCYGLEISVADGQPVPEPIRLAFERLSTIAPAGAAPYTPAEVAIFADEMIDPVTTEPPVVFPVGIDFAEAEGEGGLILTGADAATAWQFFVDRDAFAGVAIEAGDALYALAARPVLPGQG